MSLSAAFTLGALLIYQKGVAPTLRTVRLSVVCGDNGIRFEPKIVVSGGLTGESIVDSTPDTKTSRSRASSREHGQNRQPMTGDLLAQSRVWFASARYAQTQRGRQSLVSEKDSVLYLQNVFLHQSMLKSLVDLKQPLHRICSSVTRLMLHQTAVRLCSIREISCNELAWLGGANKSSQEERP